MTQTAAPPIVQRAAGFADRTAVVAHNGTLTYADLLDASARVAAALLDGRASLDGARVAFLTPPGWEYVAVQWGVWRAGGVAVPLAVSHPEAELEYVVLDADAETVIAHPEFIAVLRPVAERAGRRFLTTDEALAVAPGAVPDVAESGPAMIIYTSGTTGRPKGVVSTHANLRAQVTTLVDAWGWTADDRTLLVLPLHHVHGIVNVLACTLWSGAVCEILPRFDADETWRTIESGRLTLFMAVPTVYRKLIGAFDAADEARRERMAAGCRGLRLMVSGSAALPVQMLERWREISGHTLLERYGMTEIGMALSNPLHGERRPGSVGLPLPGVQTQVVDDEGRPVEAGTPGDLEIRGPSVFADYWRRPEATAEAFRGGWFRSGDVAVVEDGYYRLLGRRSVDIIKTGGFKVSALEIEEVLREHPAIGECAVVGIGDEEWGERVCVAVEAAGGDPVPPLAELQGWARQRLAPYKLPRDLRVVDPLPRNAMGKVMKPEVAKLFAAG
ncbi:MAG TPA: acyl-CoA synthetase [Longimicrobium sp.]|jgi:malonyl-CoA/methylmalonyl-CoA synthetase|uniref:acyl-CoA synthetase n=1 Tax=Longimicrobium sp. TaxID=2029185 RepID=UPI002EDAA1D5